MVPEVAVTDVGTSVPQLLVTVEQVPPAVDRAELNMSPTTSSLTEMSNVVWVVVPAVTVGEAEVGSVTEIESPLFVRPEFVIPLPLELLLLVLHDQTKAPITTAYKKIGR